MPVTKQDYAFTKGDSFTFTGTATDYSQNVINLTGAGLDCIAKPDPNSSDFFTGTVTTLSASAGTYSVTFPITETESLPNYPLIYDYQVRLLKGSEAYAVQGGKLYITPTVQE